MKSKTQTRNAKISRTTSWYHKALNSIPDGYARVTHGILLPDDLCYDWPNDVWRRADDEWDQYVPEDISQCVCVVRRIAYQPAPGQSVRTYTVKRGHYT